MRCPACNSEDSWTSLQWIYCVNRDCRYYDARHAQKVQDERLSEYDICLNDKVEKLILLRGEIDNSQRRPGSK